MTNPGPKQFNPRLYAAVALVWAMLAGAQFDSIFYLFAQRDVPRLWEHALFGLFFALLSLGYLWRTWPAIPKSHPWTRIGQASSSQPQSLR
jgi:hypothetical protein